MSDAQGLAPAPPKPGSRSGATGALRRRPVLKVTLYDRISSLLMASMVGVGATLFAAVTYWLSHRPPPEAELVPLEILDLEEEVDFGGSLDGVVGGTADADLGDSGGGGGGEVVESDLPAVEASINAVTSTVGTAAPQAAAAYLDSETANSSSTGSGTGGGSGTGTGGGKPPLGFGPGKGGGVPRELRWFVSFAGDSSIDEYAKQLDAFGIELGLRQPDGRLVYVSDLSKPSPTKRSAASGKDEKRLFFTWQGGDRKSADVKLFEKAGVSVAGGTIYHFYPQQLEDILATVEFKFAERKAIEIRRTYFAVVKRGNAYGFEVTRQTYLK